ncbi:MAG: MmgE/PrpD family protein [Rubrivivax sp.]|nr:MmgE/PrpD family protein [Rubrivivax sp.]
MVRHPWRLGDNPRVNAQFSAQYCAANAVVRRGSTLQHFRVEAISDPAVLALIDRVVTVGDPALDARGHAASTRRPDAEQLASATTASSTSRPVSQATTSTMRSTWRFADCAADAPHRCRRRRARPCWRPSRPGRPGGRLRTGGCWSPEPRAAPACTGLPGGV